MYNKYVASRGALIMNDMLQRLAILWDDSFVLLVHSSLEHAVQTERILIVSFSYKKYFIIAIFVHIMKLWSILN